MPGVAVSSAVKVKVAAGPAALPGTVTPGAEPFRNTVDWSVFTVTRTKLPTVTVAEPGTTDDIVANAGPTGPNVNTKSEATTTMRRTTVGTRPTDLWKRGVPTATPRDVDSLIGYA